MFKVATNGGFITFDRENRMYDTHPDARCATIFDTFEEADSHGRYAVGILFGRVNQYYDILVSVSVLNVARRIYEKEVLDGGVARKSHPVAEATA